MEKLLGHDFDVSLISGPFIESLVDPPSLFRRDLKFFRHLQSVVSIHFVLFGSEDPK